MASPQIKELKALCHHYLDLYVVSTLRVQGDKRHYQKKKRKAYHRLAQELRTDAHKCHFRNMDTVEELERAIVVLQSWTGPDGVILSQRCV